MARSTFGHQRWNVKINAEKEQMINRFIICKHIHPQIDIIKAPKSPRMR